jgi:hypothetical protein
VEIRAESAGVIRDWSLCGAHRAGSLSDLVVQPLIVIVPVALLIGMGRETLGGEAT